MSQDKGSSGVQRILVDRREDMTVAGQKSSQETGPERGFPKNPPGEGRPPEESGGLLAFPAPVVPVPTVPVPTVPVPPVPVPTASVPREPAPIRLRPPRPGGTARPRPVGRPGPGVAPSRGATVAGGGQRSATLVG